MSANENIEVLIEAERKNLEVELGDTEKEINSLETERKKEWREMESKVADYEKKIDEIKKPYEQKFKEIESKNKALDHKKWEMENKIRNIRYKICYDHIKKNKLDEFSDEDSFKGFLQAHNIFSSHIKMTQKPLANGVRIFKHTDTFEVSDALSVGYFAVKGLEIVGFQHTDKAQHRGDEPTYEAWINQKVLDGSNGFHLKYEYVGWNDKKEIRQKIPSFREFCAEVEKLKTFVGVDLSNEKNQKVLGRD